MDIIEILIIILVVSFVLFIFGREIYNRIKNKPTGECKVCKMQSKRTLDEMRRAIKTNRCSK